MMDFIKTNLGQNVIMIVGSILAVVITYFSPETRQQTIYTVLLAALGFMVVHYINRIDELSDEWKKFQKQQDYERRLMRLEVELKSLKEKK